MWLTKTLHQSAAAPLPPWHTVEPNVTPPVKKFAHLLFGSVLLYLFCPAAASTGCNSMN